MGGRRVVLAGVSWKTAPLFPLLWAKLLGSLLFQPLLTVLEFSWYSLKLRSRRLANSGVAVVDGDETPSSSVERRLIALKREMRMARHRWR